jgi:hypothetical protein
MLVGAAVVAAVVIGVADWQQRPAEAVSDSSVKRWPFSKSAPQIAAIAQAKIVENVKRSAAASVNGVSPSDWDSEFYKSKNLFPLVKKAASAGLYNHDGRAAFLVGQAIQSCALVYKSYQRNPDVETTFDADYAQMAPKAEEWARVRAREQFDRCLPMAKEDPFSDLPQRSEGYRNAAFWQQMALSNNDPVAESHQAILDLAEANYKDSTGRDATLAKAQQLISDAAQSGDPRALFMTGQVLANARNSSDPVRGVAISLAACDLGYDCSAKNPDNVFSVCVDSGACPADADYAYYMQQSLGPAAFGKAYQQAQTIVDLIARNDWDAVAAFTKLDGPQISRN